MSLTREQLEVIEMLNGGQLKSVKKSDKYRRALGILVKKRLATKDGKLFPGALKRLRKAEQRMLEEIEEL